MLTMGVLSLHKGRMLIFSGGPDLVRARAKPRELEACAKPNIIEHKANHFQEAACWLAMPAAA